MTLTVSFRYGAPDDHKVSFYYFIYFTSIIPCRHAHATESVKETSLLLYLLVRVLPPVVQW